MWTSLVNDPKHFILPQLIGLLPYGVTRGSQQFLVKFNISSVLYSLLCYGLYLVTLYFFITESFYHIYSDNSPYIILIGMYRGTILLQSCITLLMTKSWLARYVITEMDGRRMGHHKVIIMNVAGCFCGLWQKFFIIKGDWSGFLWRCWIILISSEF